ncbi:MAG: flagellar biosynthetic protein FliO [Pseudomonadota bacterium]
MRTHTTLTLVLGLLAWPATAEPLELSHQVPQMLLSLGLVLVAIFAVAWVARRFLTFRPRRAQGDMRIVSSLSVGPRERLAVVQVGDTQILVGLCPGRIDTLHVFEEPPIDVSTEDAPSFANALQTASKIKMGSSR